MDARALPEIRHYVRQLRYWSDLARIPIMKNLSTLSRSRFTALLQTGVYLGFCRGQPDLALYVAARAAAHYVIVKSNPPTRQVTFSEGLTTVRIS